MSATTPQSMEDPIVVTLNLEGCGWGFYLEQQRAMHYPPERNRVPIHITMFHQLPGEELPRIAEQAAGICRNRAAFSVNVTGLRNLGRGVAFLVQSAELLLFHAELSRIWNAHLIPQDRERFQPHITIQNKATPAEARTLLASMQATFEPFQMEAAGMDFWYYRGGPWEHIRLIPFGNE